MNVVKRMQAPTPKFFRVLRRIGIGLVAAGGALLTAPIGLPVAVLTLAEYLTVAGTVMTAVSQTAVSGDEPPEPEPVK